MNEDKDVHIKTTEDVSLEDHTLIEGFPGIGLVGTIASSYIIEKEDMKPIAHIYSKKFPSITPIHEGKPYFPVRIFKHPEKNICLLVGELIIPNQLIHELSESVLSFAKEKGVNKIISIGGMATTQKSKEKKGVHGIVSMDNLKEELDTHDVPLIKEGAAMGVSGQLIAKAAERDYPTISLLVESRKNLPDPEAAADLVEKLNEMLGMDIDTEELREEAKGIEKRMKKMVNRMKKAQNKYSESGTEPSSPMYG